MLAATALVAPPALRVSVPAPLPAVGRCEPALCVFVRGVIPLPAFGRREPTLHGTLPTATALHCLP
eukprot:1157574-Pelagomonas_calceolata.AAC.22